MGLAEKIGGYGSVAVAGLAKNVGKTVTLNHLLRRGHGLGLRLGVTSIGIDGESVDLVTATGKPEIKVYRGMHFATSETHFRQRGVEAEITGIAPRLTSLGRVVTGRAMADGKILLSGPADTSSLKHLIGELHDKGADTVLVDGALSRVSIASPAITDAMILATGAALSPDIQTIVTKTAFVCRLTEIPETTPEMRQLLESLEGDLFGIEDGIPYGLEIGSALNLEKIKDRIFSRGTIIYNPGIVSDKMMKFLSSQREIIQTELIVRDFTRLFVEPPTLGIFLRKGGKINVLRRSRLLGVTVNPYSPAGYTVDKERLTAALAQKLAVPVEYIYPDT